MTAEDSPIKLPVAAQPSPDQSVPQFRTLLKNRPVLRVELPDGSTAWLVSGYEEVRLALLDQRFSRAVAVAPGRPLGGTGAVRAGPPHQLRTPADTRLTHLVGSGMTRRRPRVRRPLAA